MPAREDLVRAVLPTRLWLEPAPLPADPTVISEPRLRPDDGAAVDAGTLGEELLRRPAVRREEREVGQHVEDDGRGAGRLLEALGRVEIMRLSLAWCR